MSKLVMTGKVSKGYACIKFADPCYPEIVRKFEGTSLKEVFSKISYKTIGDLVRLE